MYNKTLISLHIYINISHMFLEDFIEPLNYILQGPLARSFKATQAPCQLCSVSFQVKKCCKHGTFGLKYGIIGARILKKKPQKPCTWRAACTSESQTKSVYLMIRRCSGG